MGTYPPFMPGLPGVTLFNDFSGLYRPTASNADLDRLYSTSVAIYAAANFWGSTASLVKWKVLDKDKKEVNANIPEVQALRHNMPDLLHRSMISEKFRGYNLLYKEPSFSRHTYRLRWMNFNIYQLDEHFQDGLRGFRVMQGGTNYEPAEVDYIWRDDGVYWNLIDLQDDFDGVAAAEVAFMYAGVDVEAGTTMLSYFQNMAIPALFIQPAADGKLAPSEQDVADLTTLFRKIVRGAMNFGRTIFSPARWEIQQVQSKMEDLKMGELIATAREGVRIAMDVPDFVLLREGTSYAESYEARRQWLNLSFVPHMNKIGRYFEDQLIRPLYPDWTVEADYSDVPGMKEEAERLTATITAQVASGVRDIFSGQEVLGIEPNEKLRNIHMIQGVPVPVDEIPTFYAKMQAQGGLGGAMPPAPGFGGGAPAGAEVSAGDNAQGAAPSIPVGSASAKEAGTHKAAVMLGIGAHPDLIGLQQRVKELCAGQSVEWSAPDSFHVTLASFPALDDIQLATLRQYVAGMQVEPSALRIGSLGTFDNLGSYAIRFMIRQAADLEAIKDALCEFCEENNIPLGHHYHAGVTYKPHVTMGYSTVNPGRLTYNTPLTVTPQSVQLGVDNTVAYERPLSVPSKKSAYADNSQVDIDGEPTAPLTAQTLAHAHAAPVVDVPDDIWLDDVEFKELKQWRILMARKGIAYDFQPNALPVESIAYGRDLLANGYGIDAAAEAMKPHIVSSKKKLDPDLLAKAWEEADHPRAENGQFGSGGGGSTDTAESEKPAPETEKKPKEKKPKKPKESSTGEVSSGKPSWATDEKRMISRDPDGYMDYGHIDENPVNTMGDMRAENMSRTQTSVLAEPQKQAAKTYTGETYTAINGGLRKGGLDPVHDATVRDLDSAISKSELPENTVLYRGMELNDNLRNNIKPGATFTDQAYTSTSLDQGNPSRFAGGENGAVMRIKAQKGQKGLAMQSISDYPEEKEVLLPRGTKYKITGVTRDPDTGRTFIDAEIIGDAA